MRDCGISLIHYANVCVCSDRSEHLGIPQWMMVCWLELIAEAKVLLPANNMCHVCMALLLFLYIYASHSGRAVCQMPCLIRTFRKLFISRFRNFCFSRRKIPVIYTCVVCVCVHLVPKCSMSVKLHISAVEQKCSRMFQLWLGLRSRNLAHMLYVMLPALYTTYN